MSGRGSGDERGAVLIAFALGCTLLFALAAIVVDLGQLRVAREHNQRIADLGALAAGNWLGNPGGRDPSEACRAALDTARGNLPASVTLTEEGAGCAVLGTSCTPLPKDVVATGGRMSITIHYPVTDEELAEGPEGEATGRPYDGNPCERMRIEVTRTVDYAFAGVLGVQEGDVTVSTTVRGVVGYREVRVPALHALKRYGCGTISASGQGRIVVDAYSEEFPGVIGADSLGNLTGEDACSSNTNAGGYVVYGTGTGGLPSIEAKGMGASPGVLALVASKAKSSRAVCCTPDGVLPSASPSPIISRLPIDFAYNPWNRPGIDELRASATVLAGRPVDALRSEGWTIFPQDGAGWSCTTGDDTTIVAPRVVVDCPSFAPKAQADITIDATEVLLRGTVSLGTQNSLRLPSAELVVLAGSTSTSTSAISNSGTLVVNDGAAPGGPVRPCADRQVDPDVHGAVVVALAGGVSTSTSSSTTLCETFVYLAGSASPYQRTTGGYCEPELPCPTPNPSDGGRMTMFGTLDWQAANATSMPPSAANPYEDLALWTESSLPTEIKGQGNTVTTGVYFVPNGDISFTGQASEDVQLNAQFFSRTFNMSGQGTLRLMPNPSDAIKIPMADFYLIR